MVVNLFRFYNISIKARLSLPLQSWLNGIRLGKVHFNSISRHVNVLELFIKENIAGLPVWDILVKMINSGDETASIYYVFNINFKTFIITEVVDCSVSLL